MSSVATGSTEDRLARVRRAAGITRPSSYASGTEEDWLGVLSVHLDGYRNVLEAALPIMAAAGHGRILGVTSGSGWRAADAGAYSAAKRAVAAASVCALPLPDFRPPGGQRSEPCGGRVAGLGGGPTDVRPRQQDEAGDEEDQQGDDGEPVVEPFQRAYQGAGARS